jgi:hypothetical protein
MDVAAGYCRLLLEDEEQIVIVWFATAADTAGLQDGDDVVLQGAVLLGNEDRYIELQQATLIDDAE